MRDISTVIADEQVLISSASLTPERATFHLTMEIENKQQRPDPFKIEALKVVRLIAETQLIILPPRWRHMFCQVTVDYPVLCLLR
jgi:hypothetical protein